jgi:hypothetical protein
VISFPVDVAVIVALGTTSTIVSGLVFYAMIGHVNRQLPEDKQIPYFFSFSYSSLGKAGTIRREYKRFYPHGRLYRAYIVLNVLSFILMVAGAVRLSHYVL